MSIGMKLIDRSVASTSAFRSFVRENFAEVAVFAFAATPFQKSIGKEYRKALALAYTISARSGRYSDAPA